MITFKTIRYMGIKTKLLDHIIPAVARVTPEGGIVCDLMAGSNAVGYALKEKYTVYSNDVQEYSYIIAKAVIENPQFNISSDQARIDLRNNIQINMDKKNFDYFEKNYSNTYFSRTQCQAIDSIRYAIGKVENEYVRSLYLLALMVTMSKLQSTPGHFAQFMPKEHDRIIPLQKRDMEAEFFESCDYYSNLHFNGDNNIAFNHDYNILFEGDSLDAVDTIYLDSPYNQEQYSRFYHVLETVVKYDYPELSFKGLYRNNRFMSKFSYKKNVSNEFEKIMKFCKYKKINLVISYSDKGLISVDRLEQIACKYFEFVDVEYIDYKHSTQGKGYRKIKEVIIQCSH